MISPILEKSPFPVKSDVFHRPFFYLDGNTEKPQTPNTARGTGCEVTTWGAQAGSGLKVAKGGNFHHHFQKGENTWSDGKFSEAKSHPKFLNLQVWVIPFLLLDWSRIIIECPLRSFWVGVLVVHLLVDRWTLGKMDVGMKESCWSGSNFASQRLCSKPHSGNSLCSGYYNPRGGLNMITNRFLKPIVCETFLWSPCTGTWIFQITQKIYQV